MKICNQCGERKCSEHFYKEAKSVDGLRGKCIVCFNLYCKKRRNEHSVKVKKINKAWRDKNIEKSKECSSKYRKGNVEKIKEYGKKYRKDNIEKEKNRKKEYRKNNLKKLNENSKKRRKLDTRYRLTKNLRSRLWSAIKNYGAKKSTRTFDLIGCDISFFIKYIEQKFTQNMTWENYGKNGWHIDHIKPCSTFNLENDEEQKKCFHYTNLQPLWATTEIAMEYGESSEYIGNINKSDKTFL